MKKRNFNKLLALIVLILTILCNYLLLKLNILPTKYYIIFFLVSLLINIGILYLSFFRKIKRSLAVIIDFTSIILIIVLLAGIFYINGTINFFKTIKTSNYKIQNYSIIVLKDSVYKDVVDLKQKKLGISTKGFEGKGEVIRNITNKVDLEYVGLETITTQYSSLLENTIDAFVVENSYIEILKEENVLFDSETRIIYTFSIKIETTAIIKVNDITSDSFNIYISGIDTFGEINSVSRSDVNIIATVNPKTNEILLTNIPRDYYVQLHGTIGTKDKLTHAGMYGIDMSMKTIEDLLDIKIQYYIKVNFTGLIEIIDALNGIDVYSKYSFPSGTGYNYKVGINHLNGDKALAFARTRQAFIDGDRTRGENQQAVIEALVKKVSSFSIITKYDSILKSLDGSFVTNFDPKEINSLVKMQINTMPSWDIKSISLDGSDGDLPTYTYGSQPLYVMIPNQKTINKAKTLIKQIETNTIISLNTTTN